MLWQSNPLEFTEAELENIITKSVMPTPVVRAIPLRIESREIASTSLLEFVEDKGLLVCTPEREKKKVYKKSQGMGD